MKKNAFTMIELVFVLVAIGIMAAVMLPRMERNNLREAAEQVANHIRYTQHLAMVDDKFNPTDQYWYEKRWQIIFGTSANTGGMPAYTIFSDDRANGSDGEPNISEIAVSPQNPAKLLTGGYSGIIATSDERATKDMNLGIRYGISAYALSGGCSGARISFDHLGRPIQGDLHTMTGPYAAGTNRLITSDCIITLTHPTDGTITLTVTPETGYVTIN